VDCVERYAYNHSTQAGIKKAHLSDQLDLAQSIFGYTNDSSALKGRVQFSHFKAIEDNIEPLPPRTEILGSPRASYYPIYVRQYGVDFKTFMDSDFQIAGCKRYPIHQGSSVTQTQDNGNANVGTTFAPLRDGVEFQGKVRYHNLKKVELGALLSALTFHTTSGTYHNIGMAKPLGYGKIKIDIKGVEDLESYLKSFEVMMEEIVPKWYQSNPIKELLTMATEQNNAENSRLSYMVLDDFATHKTGENKDYLRCYSELHNIDSIHARTFITQEERKDNEECIRYQEDYQQIQSAQTIETIKAFLNNYQSSKYLTDQDRQTAESKIVEIEQHDASQKWEAVQKVDKKYRQKALEDFIQNYPDSLHIEKAKENLEAITNKTSNTMPKGLDFSNAKDAKGIENEIKSIQNATDEQKALLEEAIQTIYPTLKAKKKKAFAKAKHIARWLGQERLNKVLASFI